MPENTAVVSSFSDVPFFRALGIQGHRIFQKAHSFWAFVLNMETLRASFLFLLRCVLFVGEKPKVQTDGTCPALLGPSTELVVSVQLRDRRGLLAAGSIPESGCKSRASRLVLCRRSVSSSRPLTVYWPPVHGPRILEPSATRWGLPRVESGQDSVAEMNLKKPVKAHEVVALGLLISVPHCPTHGFPLLSALGHFPRAPSAAAHL